jgi:hypothetical protein
MNTYFQDYRKTIIIDGNSYKESLNLIGNNGKRIYTRYDPYGIARGHAVVFPNGNYQTFSIGDVQTLMEHTL